MLLLTAFEPFDGTGLNSSQQALETRLAQAGGLPVAGALLPVDWDRDVAALRPVAERLRPSVILHLGQYGQAVVGVERLGVNLRTATVEGRATHAPILPGAPAAYEATVPVDDLVAALLAAGVPTASSAHAGTYLCNHILYRSLHRAATGELPAAVGFVHLPLLPDQAGPERPSLPLETLVNAVGVAVETLLRWDAARAAPPVALA